MNNLCLCVCVCQRRHVFTTVQRKCEIHFDDRQRSHGKCNRVWFAVEALPYQIIATQALIIYTHTVFVLLFLRQTCADVPYCFYLHSFVDLIVFCEILTLFLLRFKLQSCMIPKWKSIFLSMPFSAELWWCSITSFGSPRHEVHDSFTKLLFGLFLEESHMNFAFYVRNGQHFSAQWQPEQFFHAVRKSHNPKLVLFFKHLL